MASLKLKYSEALKCANTNRASIENNRLGNIDMNIVAKSDLNFHGIQLQPIEQMNDIWLTSSDIAKALGYASSKSVSTIYSRNSDEFTDAMSMVIKMKTNGINNNLREKSVRVFSLRGCHLIAMFATTTIAKEFRKWVLDILDREVTQSPIAQQFTDEELCQLCWLWRHATGMAGYMMDVEPILTAAEHRLAPAYVSYPKETIFIRNKVRRMLERETMHIKADHRTEDNWRVLRNLRIPELH
ncbi:BRO family, N-terminal domain [Rosenbergiella nectarea]|uniref:BRO family, N-terminal domain n=1 Tax=Rosenbergiella nectarea TaxID=988801 RepID=A0A1H9EPZ5_9GAMM|nr:P22AR C-terminal domain-containing protein [Rosenbergiella nectarea]SEQ27695.1 BRO family, N-terminal domain [Rosenbergiella nectarea]